MGSTFTEADHLRDPRGRFAPAPASEPDVDLSPAPVLVRDARGMNVRVTPGVLDDDARYLYRNGQCLALALELAATRPGHGVTVLAYETEVGTCIQHAWARSPDGTLVDVDGGHDPDAIEELVADGGFLEAGDDEFTSWHDYGPDELDQAEAELSDWVGPQRRDLAATHAPLVPRTVGEP